MSIYRPPGCDSYTPSELETKTNASPDEWNERLWETLEADGYMFMYPIGDKGKTSGTSSWLHLPEEFPGEPLEAEPYQKVTEGAQCDHRTNAPRWTYKPVDCYPVGFRRVCGYCMAEFVRYWTREVERD